MHSVIDVCFTFEAQMVPKQAAVRLGYIALADLVGNRTVLVLTSFFCKCTIISRMPEDSGLRDGSERS